MPKPLIPVTNDAGIQAPGLVALVRYTTKLGDVIVVAPDSLQCGIGSGHNP